MSPSQLSLLTDESSALARLHNDIRFVAATVAEIAASLPVQRKPLADGTKAIHMRVTWERRAGFCPCCQRTPVCDGGGKFPNGEFDHWYGRHRNASSETWLVCGECNRRLESAEFKTGARSAFESYQDALEVVMQGPQGQLF
jgi:hypothetical protein